MRSTAERPYDTNAASSGRRDAASRVAACDVIDLRSDFLAHGTAEMSEAWARAAREPYHFGLREDPYQAALERRVAEMTAHEDALVFPTCTMANLVGIMLGAPPGTRALTHEDAHVITSEAGGAAAFAGVQLVPLAGDPRNGAAEQWRDAAADGDAQKPATSLFVLENTHNRAGGLPLSASYTTAVLAIARERGIRTHLDGSRLFHAAAAFGTTIAPLAQGFDTVSLSLNKGFGAPLAAVLAGSRENIARLSCDNDSAAAFAPPDPRQRRRSPPSTTSRTSPTCSDSRDASRRVWRRSPVCGSIFRRPPRTSSSSS
jgi:threonine aldolase